MNVYYLCNYKEDLIGNFCVSTWLGSGMPRELVKHDFWVCLWGCFRKRSVFDLVSWVKQMASCKVLSNPRRAQIEGKGRRSPSSLSELGCPPSPALDHQCFWFWGFQTPIGTYTLSPRFSAPFGLGLHYSGLPRPPAADGRLRDFSAPTAAWANCYNNLLLRTSLYSLLVLFLWRRTLTNTQGKGFNLN